MDRRLNAARVSQNPLEQTEILADEVLSGRLLGIVEYLRFGSFKKPSLKDERDGRNVILQLNRASGRDDNSHRQWLSFSLEQLSSHLHQGRRSLSCALYDTCSR